MINQINKCNIVQTFKSSELGKNCFIQSQMPDTYTRSNSVSFGSSITKSRSFFSRIADNIREFYRLHISPPPHIVQEVSEIRKGELLDTETFMKISTDTKEFLRKKVGKDITSAVDDTLSCAVALKKHYQQIYGDENFQIVSIGHSPELISKALEHMGINVKYIPLSDLSCCPTYETFKKEVSSAPNFLKFIKELGLTKEQVDKNTKQIIFLDYTNKGRTLNLVKQLFQEHFNLPKGRVDFRSLNKDLKYCAQDFEEGELKLPKNLKFTTKQADRYIEEYLKKTKVEDFSNIPYLGYNNLNSVYERINGYKNPSGKLFNFKLLDKIEQLDCSALKVDSTLKSKTLDEKTYKKLLTKADRILEEEGRPTITEAAKKTVPKALSLKALYDKTYGKGNYKIVSIGTSPSLLATSIESAGVETKYLPISGLISGDYDDFIKAIQKSPNYMKFLKELGLTKEAIESGNKKIVFIDYTASGATLRKIKQLFEDYFKISKDKIEFRSVNHDLYTTVKNQTVSTKNPETQDSMFDYIQDYLTNNKFAKYRIVPSLPFKEIDSVYTVLGEELDPISKLLKFHIQKTTKETISK